MAALRIELEYIQAELDVKKSALMTELKQKKCDMEGVKKNREKKKGIPEASST